MATKKLRAYPPKPKEKASAAVWERYYEKLKEIDRINQDAVKEVSAKKAIVKKVNEHIAKSAVKPKARKKSPNIRVRKASGWY